MPRAFRRVIGETGFLLGVAFFVVLAAFPFYWMLITTFKTNSDLYNVANTPFWFNEWPTLEHLKHLFDERLLAGCWWNRLSFGVWVSAFTLVLRTRPGSGGPALPA